MKSHTTEHFCMKILLKCTCSINFQERYVHNFFNLAQIWAPNLCCFTYFVRFVNMKLFSKSRQKQFHIHNLYKTCKSIKNLSPYFDLIEETIYESVLHFFISTTFTENTTTQLILWNSWNDIFGCSPRISASIEQTPRHSCRLWLSLIL